MEGLRYFTYRRYWENKEYAKLEAEQNEYLKHATERYREPRIEALYRPWLLGQIPVNAVTEEFRRLAPRRKVSFRTEQASEASCSAQRLAGRVGHDVDAGAVGDEFFECLGVEGQRFAMRGVL